MDLAIRAARTSARSAARPWLVMVRSGLVVIVLGLTACGANTVQELAGISREGPDEFQVVRRAPLTMPPDYNLRPPSDTVVERQRPVATAADTRAFLTGANGTSGSELDGAEAELLARSNVEVTPSIREIIAEEDAQLRSLDSLNVLAVLDFQRRLYQPDPDVLDPVAEANRLAAEGTNNIAIERVGTVPLDRLDGSNEEDS